MQNLKQKRFNYLLRKLAANTITLSACVLGALAFAVVLLGTIFTAIFITEQSLISPMLLLPLMIAVPALVIFKVMALCNAQVKRARSIPYVPPVRNQIDQLPNDEVLVRAATQPDDHALLLRGAAAQVTAEADELLRSL
jgi:hypothetical protein